jgi:hypothetical protein
VPPGRRLSREEALSLLRAGDGIATDEPSWACRVGPLVLRFPSFAWRRRALRAHDLHHLMAGYPMTMRGEFQMASWELGAGRYPDWRATFFCSPLIVAGFLWSPRRMIAAFRSGRRSQSLYSSLAEEAE